MTVHYKVWLEIEEIDESRDHYQTVDTPGGAVATFEDYEAARRFVEQANRELKGLDADELIQASDALFDDCNLAPETS